MGSLGVFRLDGVLVRGKPLLVTDEFRLVRVNILQVALRNLGVVVVLREFNRSPRSPRLKP